MGRTIDCSAATPPARLSETESEARTSLFGDVIRIDVQPEACKEAVGNFALGAEYFAPLYSAVPALFLSGTLDSNTPPMKAERMRWGFPRSTLIVAENGFHETLPAEDAQAVVVDFFKGRMWQGAM
jgi:alpha-beta hydrolase superfamily lysophospholipase